jgi:uncharacterized protein (DUF362 family)
MEKKGIFDLARNRRFDVVDFEQIADRDWVSLPRRARTGRTGSRCRGWSSTRSKTHGAGGVFTMSLKLAVGLTPKGIRRPMHPWRQPR